MPTSSRLRTGVELYTGPEGPRLRVDGRDHDVRLAPDDVDALRAALLDGGEPATSTARAALGSMVEAGLADVPPRRVTVVGDGRLAGPLRAALHRMRVPSGGAPVMASDEPHDHAACWIAGHRVVLAPGAVSPRDVTARHRAATGHREPDPRNGTTPLVAEAPLHAGLELAAVTVVTELLRTDRPPHEALVVDLHRLAVTRHVVLPVPPAPR